MHKGGNEHARNRAIVSVHVVYTSWGERERSRRQYSSQVSVFKPALFTEHSNADKMKKNIVKKRRTVADSVANVGESGIGIVALALP